MDLLEKDVQDTLLVKPFNVGAHLRLSTPFIPQSNIRSCLFAISNQFGWAIIAIQSFENDQSGPAFILTRVEKLSQSLKNAEPHVNTWITSQDAHVTIPISTFCDPNSVFLTHLAFAASDRLIVAATSDGTLSIFSLQNLISKTNITPLRKLTAHSNIPVQALIPNPAPGGSFSGLIAVVYADSTIRVLDLYDVQKVHWEAQSITAAEWSPMGKRLIVGYKDGKLEYFTHDGQSKGVIEAPAQAEGMEG
ncbi:uncharacterized protein MELLADRAFT_64427 [Melampsora larici-populina 98AG31]|uniref:Nucleoporin Nup159/Nup146 N-terminal domain-containing protein n=1 Tax=Melampsora larici-populina (strain 98AG31 / pathotype 3-4-7) TaxID=747676 RepID=F4RRE3_MELLP|nr:uncharacterized protein MELLADRAFT_64427 [Melampsora larici-populina 98AG31]EGG05048.1 hypothetical protein MELLADRAFT_64427 [Melampsora larici-populina 98AG31]